ncbi:MAG TPA: transglutaminase-like domain-containing protein, partial [Candidatus Eisenbacteria bacterium]|nr:transglutaminase-like domain-containing protein [Candidatus Eisenbacteria bacterium]
MTPGAGARSVRIELACFAALAALATLQWTSLVAHPPAGRAFGAVLLATGAGAALAATRRADRGPGVRWGIAAGAALAGLCAGLVAVGLPARMLLPGHWDELGDNVGHALNGLGDVPVPYAGADTWTRLVILLAGPLVAGLAALAAFWPARRRLAGRILALVLLAGLYLVAVAWAASGRQLAGGAFLLVLVCAWLWLPGVDPARRATAVLAVGAAAAIAIPATAAITGRGLLDYRHWGLLSANGQSFNWDQTYGPLSWPQKGTPLLEVAADHSHYWKATNLDSFDGTRWVRSTAAGPEPALGEPLKLHPKGTPPRPNPEWVERINITNRGLSSDFAIGAGTILALRGIDARPSPDGVWSMTRELRPGSSYTALVYDPKPSEAQMQAAGTAYPAAARRYVSFSLPGSADVRVPFWSRSGPASIGAQVSGTPYAGMYALARRLAAGAGSPYVAARRIELYLRDHYAYRQDVPRHAYPLPAFLATDHAGYCQQFSGTMALMLRMLGIPSRVATGFSPGGRNPERINFLVDDTDAHNWVEVFFPRIGWVTFEPTPATSPAATQLDDNALGVTKRGPTQGIRGGQSVGVRTGNSPSLKRSPSSPAPFAAGRGGPSLWLLPAGIAGLLGLAATGTYAIRRWRRSRMGPDELSAAEL